MRASAEAQGGEFGRPFPAAGKFSWATAENAVGTQGAEISAEVRVLTQCGDFGVSGGECELQQCRATAENGEYFFSQGISPEQQREQWLARAVQRGWLRTSVPADRPTGSELTGKQAYGQTGLRANGPTGKQAYGQTGLRANAGAFTPRVVLESGAQDREEAVVGSGDDVTGLDGLLQAWQQTSDGRAKMRRVCDQLLWYHTWIGKPFTAVGNALNRNI